MKTLVLFNHTNIKVIWESECLYYWVKIEQTNLILTGSNELWDWSFYKWSFICCDGIRWWTHGNKSEKMHTFSIQLIPCFFIVQLVEVVIRPLW